MRDTTAEINFSEQSISFWRDEDIVRLDHEIYFLFKSDVDPRGRFINTPPAISVILRELSINKMSYITLSDRDGVTHVNILAGRLVVLGTLRKNNDDNFRLWLNKRNGVSFADNKTRARIISTGIRTAHLGIQLVTGTKLAEREQDDSFIKKGGYAEALYRLKDKINMQASSQTTDTPSDAALHEDEINLLDTVQQYIDSEHEIEQALARQTPPFSYTCKRPDPRPQVLRQFFQLDIEPADYKRLLNLKPSMLSLGDPDADLVPVEIVDLEPKSGTPMIIISVEKQLSVKDIADQGQLFLDAPPTLKKVRSQVVKEMKEQLSLNKWFAPVAAATYSFGKLKSEEIYIPESKFPPNPSQLDAIFRGVGTNDYLLVLGPPGTGKTTVILRWVKHFVHQGLRVLVTSQNNKAVDNVLERLAQEKDTQCVRLGNENKVSESVSHLLIDRVAKDIQQQLTNRLDTYREKLSVYIKYHELLLPAIKSHMQLLNAPQRRKELALLDNLNMKISSIRVKIVEIERQTKMPESEIISADAQRSTFAEKVLWATHLAVFNPVRWIALPLYLLKLKTAEYKYNKNTRKLTKLRNKIQSLQQNIDTLQNQIAPISKAIRESAYIAYQDVQFSPDKMPNTLAAIPPPYDESSDLINTHQQAIDILQNTRKVSEELESWHKTITTERQQSLYPILLSMVDVVGATCIGINTNYAFKETPFDVVIVDESGQIQIHNLIVPLSRAPKAILVGDHKQLPPVVGEEMIEELEARDERTDLYKSSWFEWLWENSPEDRKAMLDTQFRCPAVISDYISAAFYEDKYHAGTGMDAKLPLFKFTSSPVLFIDTSSLPGAQRYEKSRNNEGRNEVLDNSIETQLVINVLERAINESPNLAKNNEIGVIVPYANHVKKIQQCIEQTRRNNTSCLNQISAPLKDLVASVDSYQGQERDLIILSFTRSNAKGQVGFLQDWRRLNVAMTRAKKQLIMIGDLSTLTHLRNPNATDAEFKNAMKDLSSFVKARCQYQTADTWLNKTAQKN